MWLGIAVGVVLATVIATILWFKKSGASLVLFHRSGFKGFRMGPTTERFYEADSAQLRAAIKAVLEDGLLDHLFVGPRPDGYGVALSREGDLTLIDIQFLTLKDEALMISTKEAMIAIECPLAMDMDWNVGMGPDLASTTMRFSVPHDVEGAYLAVETAINARYDHPDARWVSGMRDADFKVKKWGPSIQKIHDPLGAIFKKEG